MTEMATDLEFRSAHGDWVRLRTLILLRWAAIAGQTAALIVAYDYLGINFSVSLCGFVVGASVVVNLVSMVFFPPSTRLTEPVAALSLLFDLLQLALLLFLTGGLSNPFALLFLAPATIAATALHTRTTLALIAATITLVTIVGLVHRPLSMRDGSDLHIPPTLEFGFWLAIVIGVVFLGLYARKVTSEIRAMDNALFATQMALAREQKLTDLGGVIAATAHELGTPLATIKLVSSELADELSDRPDLLADARLIGAQTGRCHEILQAMGRAGKDDKLMQSAPLLALIREAADPHSRRGKVLHFGKPATDLAEPIVRRAPEIVHGLRNLIQNAVDFSRGNVWVDAAWTRDEITIVIADDGPGIAAAILSRIGDPFLRARGPDREQGTTVRPAYHGMGLGLFIAKTLLERTGARLGFSNGTGTERAGAQVALRWPRARLEIGPNHLVGENQLFDG